MKHLEKNEDHDYLFENNSLFVLSILNFVCFYLWNNMYAIRNNKLPLWLQIKLKSHNS